jgi:hypothetical protein
LLHLQKLVTFASGTNNTQEKIVSAPAEVPVSDMIAKIMQIEKLAPRCAGDSITHRFMRYMASREAMYLREDETVFPEIFLMIFVTALSDAASGVNSFTGERFPRTIANQSSLIYSLVERDLPVIADAIFPPEFATEVKDLIESVKAELAAIAPAPEKKRVGRR